MTTTRTPKTLLMSEDLRHRSTSCFVDVKERRRMGEAESLLFNKEHTMKRIISQTTQPAQMNDGELCSMTRRGEGGSTVTLYSVQSTLWTEHLIDNHLPHAPTKSLTQEWDTDIGQLQCYDLNASRIPGLFLRNMLKYQHDGKVSGSRVTRWCRLLTGAFGYASGNIQTNSVFTKW